MELTTVLLLAVFLIPPVVIAVAAVLYLRAARSPRSVALAVGAVGQLLVTLAQRAFGLLIAPGMFRSGAIASPRAYASFSQGFSVVGLAFSLVFSISLLLLLRDLSRPATSA